MLMDKKYYSIVDKAEFNLYKNDELTFIEDASSIELNQVVWDSAKQQAWVKKDAIQSARFLVDLGQLNIGDTIRVSCEVKNIMGNKVGISLFKYTTPSSYADSDFWYTTGTDWERIDTIFTIKDDLLHKLQFGVGGSNQVTEYKIKNIKIEVLSKVSVDKNYRIAKLRTVGGVFVLNTNFESDTCIVENSSNYVTVTFAKPLPRKPLIFIDNDYYVVDNKYIVKGSNATVNSIMFKVYLSAETTTPVNISTLEQYMGVSILLVC